MRIIIELDAETARQLEFIQNQTNQDHALVIQQSIGLYHQQLQPHSRFYTSTPALARYELANALAANAITN